jgi:hypothetical protein
MIEDITASGNLNALMGVHPDASTYARQNASTRMQATGVWTGPSWNDSDWLAEDWARVFYGSTNQVTQPL